MLEKQERDCVRLTPEIIGAFLDDQRTRGNSPASADVYRRNLINLYEYLPEDKQLRVETGKNWKAWMEGQGVAPRTINARLSALNSLSDYLGHREFQTHDFLKVPEILQPELTRAEYLRLLQAAKAMEKEQTYLLIKAIGGAGLRAQELPQLTADAVKSGAVELRYHNNRCKRITRIPVGLQAELLDYINRKGSWNGPVFRTAGGLPLSRTRVCCLLRAVSHTARVAPEKATPKCLWNMYQSTRESILSNLSVLADQAYAQIMDQEQRAAGWDT